MPEFFAQYSGFLTIGFMILVFYFLLIRPQQKQQKQRLAMLEALKKGDKVLNHGGIIGTITEVKDDRIIVRIGDKVEVAMIKEGVARVLND